MNPPPLHNQGFVRQIFGFRGVRIVGPPGPPACAVFMGATPVVNITDDVMKAARVDLKFMFFMSGLHFCSASIAADIWRLDKRV